MTGTRTVGRLAPSPTGGLHLGHARTFLAAWLSARSAGGRVILRIEDLDASRVRPGAAEGMIEDLRWLGLDWDEGPYVQSERMERYEAALDVLKAEERVYPCTCTRAEIARMASAPHAEDEGPTYPGTCSGRTASDGDRLGDANFAWRFRVHAEQVEWDDLFQGRLAADPKNVGGDFLVGRNRLGPAYQLAVVCDDAAMGVTEVIRGLDLVPSTPRQILLYEALGWEPPRFGHIPLVLDQEGRRLAKRDESLKLATIRERGVEPRSILRMLAESLGIEEAGKALRPIDLVGSWDRDRVPRDPWIIPPIPERP